MNAPRLVLASGSPRRRELLSLAGFAFEVDVSDVDETIEQGESAVAATGRLAVAKAEAVVRRRAAIPQQDAAKRTASLLSREVVLGADTTVVVDERILGKPADREEAVRMLLSLAGRNHLVFTAWALLPVGATTGRAEGGISRSTVRMREISRAEAESYADSGEPMDKAGAYAAQGEGRRFIGAIVGPLDNVIGLPMTPVVRALARSGVRPS
jgi:septum formation protein